jgi:hypothetical protein
MKVLETSEKDLSMCTLPLALRTDFCERMSTKRMCTKRPLNEHVCAISGGADIRSGGE